MASLLRRLGLAMLLLLVLNALGFWYALQFTPRGAQAEIDRPSFGERYSAYLSAAAAGDWGSSRGVSTGTSIRRALANSAVLVLPALALVLLLGVLLGMASLGRHDQRITSGAVAGFATGAALPGFFLGSLVILLMLYGSRWLGFRRGSILPIQGYGLDAHLVLPILTLAISPLLYVAGITAGALEHELQQDYVRVARGKGLSWRRLRWRHAFPNIAGHIAQSFGHAMRLLITELIVVEALFDWPGLGQLFMRSIRIGSDYYTAVEGRPELLAAVAVVFGALLLSADALAAVLRWSADPRARAGSNGAPP